MTDGFRNPLLAAALWMTAILYFCVQWTGASTIVRNKIFDPSRDTERADFASMIRLLSDAAQRACGGHVPRKLLFADGDIVVSYLPTAHDTLGGCEIERETLATLYSMADLDECNIVYIREFSPGYPYGLAVDPHHGPRSGRAEEIPWTEIGRWTSADGIYGFALYSHTCTAGKG